MWRGRDERLKDCRWGLLFLRLPTMFYQLGRYFFFLGLFGTKKGRTQHWFLHGQLWPTFRGMDGRQVRCCLKHVILELVGSGSSAPWTPSPERAVQQPLSLHLTLTALLQAHCCFQASHEGFAYGCTSHGPDYKSPLQKHRLQLRPIRIPQFQLSQSTLISCLREMMSSC